MAGIASLPVYCRIVCPALAAWPCLSYHPAGQKERRPLCLLAGEFTGWPLSAAWHGGPGPTHTKGPPALAGRPFVRQNILLSILRFCFGVLRRLRRKTSHALRQATQPRAPAGEAAFFLNFPNFPNRLCVCAVYTQNNRWKEATRPVQKWGTLPR